MAKKIGVEVQCITCKGKRFIDQEEGARLSATGSVPMCENCYMPMIARKAFA